MGEVEPEITEAKRIRQFAAFFKSYMGVSSFVVAALPVPVTMLKLVPVFHEDAGSASVLTSLTCFLILAFIFFSRHSLARWLFDLAWVYVDEAGVTIRKWTSRRSSLPWIIASLIIGSVALFLLYLFLIFALEAGFAGLRPAFMDTELHRVILIGTYAAFFAAGEAAFVLMATKEYLQDLLKISEEDLIYPVPPRRRFEEAGGRSAEFGVEGAAGDERASLPGSPNPASEGTAG